MDNDNNTQDKEEERKVKQLNQEIMFVFEKHAAPFGHASASLLSVLSETVVSPKHQLSFRSIILNYITSTYAKFKIVAFINGLISYDH